MQIINLLPVLKSCLRLWNVKPNRNEFLSAYFKVIKRHAPFEFRFYPGDLYDALTRLEHWDHYRKLALRLNPAEEERRTASIISKIETLLGRRLHGRILLVGTFDILDGYAQYDRGTHTVFLGMDQPDLTNQIKNILIAHELTHVAREAQPQIWKAWGINPKMSSTQFPLKQPMIEHLFGEGFSCYISSLLFPRHSPWAYVYQNKASYQHILRGAASLDTLIHSQLKDSKSKYYKLYHVESYGFPMPIFSHYTWAWHWVKQLQKDMVGGDLKKLVTLPSCQMIEHALHFRLQQTIRTS